MKRFIMDGVLVFILVLIGSSMMQPQPVSLLEEKIDSFEQDVVNHKILFPAVEGIEVKEIQMNKASKLAKTSSEFIEKGVRVTVETVASIFMAIVE